MQGSQVLNPHMRFCMPFYELPLEVRVHELQGERSPNIILLSIVVCFATVLLNLMVNPINHAWFTAPLPTRPFRQVQACID